MATLVIKNLPESLHMQLKERALRNNRSLNKEAVAVLEKAIQMSAESDAVAADALDALFAAGDALASQGVDFKAWAASSRNVWL